MATPEPVTLYYVDATGTGQMTTVQTTTKASHHTVTIGFATPTSHPDPLPMGRFFYTLPHIHAKL